MGKKDRNITIYTISKELGISPSTVSRALRGSPLVKDETREKVLSLSDKLGYTSNFTAKSLRSGKSYTIAVLSDDITNPFFALMMKGIEEVLIKEHYNVILGNIENDLDKALKYFNILTQRSIEGVIYINPEGKGTRYLQKTDIFPIVFTYTSPPSQTSIPSVVPDNLYGGYVATEYLVRLGHKKIAILVGPLDFQASIDRLEGYKKCLEDYNINVDLSLIKYCGDWGQENGYKQMKDLLSSGNLPTAVIAGNDLIAVGIMDAVREMGLKIPEDISIIGYDNRDICNFTRPKLTTIDLSLVQIGRKSAELLIRLINGEILDGNLLFKIKGELVIRDSCSLRGGDVQER